MIDELVVVVQHFNMFFFVTRYDTMYDAIHFERSFFYTHSHTCEASNYIVY